MRMPGVTMVMMGGHELLYYNICGRCKSERLQRLAKTLIFLSFGMMDELPIHGLKAMLRSPFQPLPPASHPAKDP